MKIKFTLFLSAMLFISICSFAQTQVPNGNFENWTDTVNAQSWGSNNYSLGGFLNYNFVHQSTDAHSGTYAAMLETKNIPLLGDMGGLITLGSYDMLAGLSGGAAITGKPTNLQGYFKYAPVSGDTMAIIVIMTSWNGGSRDTLFYDGVMSVSTVSSYTMFDIPITYTPSTATPDTVNIIAVSSAGYAPQIGSKLYIDDLVFVYNNAGIQEENNANLISVFPNPTTGDLNILLDGSNNEIRIFNLIGEEIVSQRSSENSMNIDLSNYPSGIYLLQVDNGASKVFRKIVVSR